MPGYTVSSSAEIRTMVITPDASLASAVLDIAQDLGIVAEVPDLCAGIPVTQHREKFEAILIDFDLVPNAEIVLMALHRNPANHGTTTFAVASGDTRRQVAKNNGANFLLGRPLDRRELRRSFYDAYQAMTRERRRYFRCTAELPVLLTRGDDTHLMARTSNISASGMSIVSSVTLYPGEELGIALDVCSGNPEIVARGAVVWDDRHGKSGIRFQSLTAESQNILGRWLDVEFNRQRKNSVRELQKAWTASHSGR